MKYIVLDSSPLSLLTKGLDGGEVDDCVNWLNGKTTKGVHAVVPEIIDYELRRELIRAGKMASVRRLDVFLKLPTVVYLPITTEAMRLAAELWANVRQQGLPTADEHALDADVILAAQVISAGYSSGDYVVATSNVKHLARLVAADIWSNI